MTATPAIASDDVVATFDEVASKARAPLLVLRPLEAFLDRHGLGAGPLEVAPIGDGHSNVTFVLRRSGCEAVIRRPPRPPLPPSAHDVLREARVLRALEGIARVPRLLAVADDSTIIGSPFYLMELVPGFVITDTTPPCLATPDARRRAGEELVDALVELHAVDWRAAGLERFGRATGYLDRQIRRFAGLWEQLSTRDLPSVGRVRDWLAARIPASPAASIVHGDYRLGNVVFAPSLPTRLTAILDWEMATIGDPLADLGYLSMLWVDRCDRPFAAFEVSSVTREEGYPQRAELIDRYSRRSGRSVEHIRWYQVLALWKAAVFMEGNYRRATTGASDDEFAKGFGDGVVKLAARAEELTRGQ